MKLSSHSFIWLDPDVLRCKHFVGNHSLFYCYRLHSTDFVPQVLVVLGIQITTNLSFLIHLKPQRYYKHQLIFLSLMEVEFEGLFLLIRILFPTLRLLSHKFRSYIESTDLAKKDLLQNAFWHTFQLHTL